MDKEGEILSIDTEDSNHQTEEPSREIRDLDYTSYGMYGELRDVYAKEIREEKTERIVWVYNLIRVEMIKSKRKGKRGIFICLVISGQASIFSIQRFF